MCGGTNLTDNKTQGPTFFMPQAALNAFYILTSINK